MSSPLRPYRAILPPVIGSGTPVVVGKLIGSPRSTRTARNAKQLGLHRVAAPADGLGRHDLDAGALGAASHDRRVLAARRRRR